MVASFMVLSIWRMAPPFMPMPISSLTQSGSVTFQPLMKVRRSNEAGQLLAKGRGDIPGRRRGLVVCVNKADFPASLPILPVPPVLDGSAGGPEDEPRQALTGKTSWSLVMLHCSFDDDGHRAQGFELFGELPLLLLQPSNLGKAGFVTFKDQEPFF